jgi:hypothetical protein
MKLVQMLATDCIKVDGYIRSCIYDLTRQQYFLFKKFDSLEELGNEELNFLRNEDVVLQIPKGVQKQFNKINFKFESNQIIAACQLSYFDYFDITKLTELYCRDFAFIINGEVQNKLDVIKLHLEKLNNLPINSVEIILQNCFVDDEILKSIKNIVERFNFCKILILESVSYDFSMRLPPNVILRRNSLNQKEMNDFYINITAFSESQSFNLFYHQLMIIDEQGQIRNSHFNNTVFGKINSICSETLKKITLSENYRKIGEIKKNVIDNCKICEFRYMCCTDKVPIQRRSNLSEFYYATECSYNPYIGSIPFCVYS